MVLGDRILDIDGADAFLVETASHLTMQLEIQALIEQ